MAPLDDDDGTVRRGQRGNGLQITGELARGVVGVQLRQGFLVPVEGGQREPHPFRQIREAADKFEGFRYEIEFESNEFAVAGSSVVVNIKIYGLSGKLADSPLSMKEILTRSGTPIHEYWTSPSKERQARANRDDKGG